MELSRTRWMTRLALTVALSVVLSLVGYGLPRGGKVSLESVPLLVFALAYGPGSGVLAGLLFGLIEAMLESNGVVFGFPQVCLDYLLAFGSLGLAGLFRQAGNRYGISAGVALGMSARFACHLLSGFLWFTAGNLVASALYNLSYLVPDTIAALLLVPPLLRRVMR